ncbi:hypothetical protein NEF87_004624 [Candidatus Lokiarchaeum ossiferum]|uniref:Tc1-like transposase DDE domain-containing protein n=1 Tax=Candidatus Lokiarchaeum ossiferum TaxID=2951803 RepID=A0ABY6HXT4_9ARCH|nr:hypothetical protein NEF87_004624 [Candidatus Lokiarchaeum sp. B-35]
MESASTKWSKGKEKIGGREVSKDFVSTKRRKSIVSFSYPAYTPNLEFREDYSQNENSWIFRYQSFSYRFGF